VLIVGNWKMNGTLASLAQARAATAPDAAITAQRLLCVPATLIAAFAAAGVAVGGQDCHAAASGAHTGDISAAMLADAGASHVIVGHSERRANHAECDATVAAKARAVWAAGLVAIICVGETLAQRDAGNTLAIIGGQLAGSIPNGATPGNTVLAYEPVWAIGTGRTATAAQVAHVHGAIDTAVRSRFGAALRILYGGSVKPENAAELLAIAHVSGALVGGASLHAADFLAIARAAPGPRP
jgi:triosephosphate isomerase (TIM)